MKVVHLIESLGRGGAERLLVSNLAPMDRASIDHVVVHMFRPDALRPEIEALGVQCIDLDLESSWSLPAWLVKLRRLLKAIEPDLLHTNLIKADIVGRIAGRSLRIPVVSTIHESPYYPEVYIDNPGLNRAKYSLIQLVDRVTAATCVDVFVAVSEFSRDACEKYLGIPRDRVRVIYNSLDPDDFRCPLVESLDALRRELSLSGSDKILVNIARLAPQKGHR